MAYSHLASPSATRDVLGRFGLGTKKALGQHFLVDDGIIGRILKLSEVGLDDVVLEVGPGIGTLTVALLAASRGVVAIERDRDLPAVLAETCAQDSDKLVLLSADALKVTDAELVSACAAFDGALPTMFVANLPYAVAATLVLDYLERFESLQSATVMVQSEVADRMAASPGNKNYGAYTVKLRLVAEVEDRFQVSPGCFLPPPHVESAVVRMKRRPFEYEGTPVTSELAHAAAFAADAAFAQRRKNIRNSMGGHLSSFGLAGGKGSLGDELGELIVECDVDPLTRGETLDVPDFCRLGQALLDRDLIPQSRR